MPAPMPPKSPINAGNAINGRLPEGDKKPGFNINKVPASAAKTQASW